MRLRIHVYTAAAQIPWPEVLRPGRALIYHLLTRGDRQLGEQLHTHGLPGRTSRGVAPFGHSGVRFPTAQPQPGVYAAGGAGFVELGTPLRTVALAWLRALDGLDYIDWGGVALRVNDAEVITPPPELETGRAVWETSTPVFLRTARTDGEATILPGDTRYDGCLGRNTRRKLDALGIAGGMSVDTISSRAQRSFVTAADTKGAGSSTGAPITVRVKGHPDALRAIWCWGLGQKTAAGLGWIGEADGADQS